MHNEPTKDQYNEYVEQVTPASSRLMNCVRAFFVGGAICTIGEGIKQTVMHWLQLGEKDALLAVTVTLVLLSVLLTGFNLYSKITKFGGAGGLVPITGFANSVASPAIEYQKEGQVFGIGVKIFTFAGPVILYGILSSFLLGIIYMILVRLGVM